MHSKDRSSLTATDLFASAAAALALMTGVLAVGMSTFVHSLNERDRISFNLQELSWWSGLRVAFDLNTRTIPVPQPIQAPIVVPEKIVVQKRVVAKKRVVSTAKKVIQAHTVAVQQVSRSVQVDQVELSKMQGLHQLLRSRFVVAVNTQSELNTHLLAKTTVIRNDEGGSTQSNKDNGPRDNQERTLVAMTVVQANKAAQPKQEQKPVAAATVSVPASAIVEPNSRVVTTHEAVETKPVVTIATPKTVVQPSVSLAASQDTLTHEMAAPKPASVEAPAEPKMSTQSQAKVDPVVKVKVANPSSSSGQYKTAAKIMSSMDAQTKIASAQMTTQKNEYSPGVVLPLPLSIKPAMTSSSSLLKNGYPVAGYSSMPRPKASTVVAGLVGPAKIPVPVPTLPPAPNPVPKPAPRPFGILSADVNGGPDLATQFEQLSCEEGAVIEAFQVKSPVVHRQGVLSYEGPASENQGRWLKTTAADHWPTLSWQPTESCKQGIQLISTNTAILLARLAGGAPLQHGAGIVFGRIPRGWSVEFSGRSEAVVYLDDRNQLALHAEQERTFALVNAAPGAQFVHLVEQSGLARASVAVPVVEDHATYLDLRSPVQRDLNGTVYDGGTERLRGVAQMTVRVVGQPSKTAVTNKRGEFQIPGVYTFSRMPIFVETLIDSDDSNEFVHRYRLTPLHMKRASLFRFSPSMVQSWLGQLEGGISKESGLVVAAFPVLASQFEAAPLKPIVRPLLSNATLLTETYALSGEDQLLPGMPIGGKNRRLIAVQISEGPVLAELQDASKTGGRKSVWSELLMSSRGVVNVLGPW